MLAPAAVSLAQASLDASVRSVEVPTQPVTTRPDSVMSFVIGTRNVTTGNTVTDLVAGRTYVVRVSAINSIGFGPAAYPVPTAATTVNG